MLLTSTTTIANPIDGIAAMLIVLGVLIIGVLMMVSVRAKIANRNTDKSTARETLQQLRRHAGRTDDQDGASARFLETAQQLSAQLDNKAERLEQLLAEAEQRITQLRALTGTEDMPRRNSQRSAPIVEVPPRPTADPLAASIYQLADSGAPPIQIAQQLDEQVGKVELILALRKASRVL